MENWSFFAASGVCAASRTRAGIVEHDFLLFRMIGGAHQRSRFDVWKTKRKAGCSKLSKLSRSIKTLDGKVIFTRL